MVGERIGEEIQTEGIIGDTVLFHALGDGKVFIKMLVSIVTR